MANGKVYLVGAGPGDPGLITVKGLETIRRADVILYDALASKELLDEAPEGCRVFYVGKRAGAHSMSQEMINSHLVKLARKGKRVVRLKGGDPYVYGRGGEEAIACRLAGIEVEVVPGVSSAMAVPAYAGIPVLQRGLAGSVLFLHGRVRGGGETERVVPDLSEKPTPTPTKLARDEDPSHLDVSLVAEIDGLAEDSQSRPLDVDWEAACRAADTLVILMGVSRMEAIRDGLLAGGRPPGQPVAVIQWGTTPLQKTVVSTVRDFPAEVRKAGVANPAVIVVGEVVNLRSELSVFEGRPLFGWKVAIAGDTSDAGALADALGERGAQTLVAGCARQSALAASPAELNTLLDEFRAASHVVFTRPGLVQTFIASARESALVPMELLAGKGVLAIGGETLVALSRAGLSAREVPRSIETEAFRKALDRGYGESRIVVVESEDDWGEVSEELEDAGARVTPLVVYGAQAEPRGLERLAHALNRDEVRVVVVATEGAASVLVRQWGKPTLAAHAEKVAFAARTAGVETILAKAGLKCAVVGGPDGDDAALVEALVQWRGEQTVSPPADDSLGSYAGE